MSVILNRRVKYDSYMCQNYFPELFWHHTITTQLLVTPQSFGVLFSVSQNNTWYLYNV